MHGNYIVGISCTILNAGKLLNYACYGVRAVKLAGIFLKDATQVANGMLCA